MSTAPPAGPVLPAGLVPSAGPVLPAQVPGRAQVPPPAARPDAHDEHVRRLWPRSLAAGARRSRAHRRALERLAVAEAAAGHLDRALGLVASAAEVGWLHHSGELVSPVLEDVLARVAAALGPWPASDRVVSPVPRRVLHVMTEAHPTGGHSRLAWRWIARHAPARHDVVLTGQEDAVPQPLRDAAAAAGGTVTVQTGSPTERVLDLRRRMVDADLVVLHVHPHDAVAVAAAASPDRAVPAVLVNHADHVFWIGASAVDRVLCIRESGRAVAVARRGVPGSRVAVLPMPLGPVPDLPPRPRASRTLLTVGSAYKFAPMGDLGLADLVAAHLDGDPAADAVVVGPPPDDPVWAQAVARHPGRVRLLGRVDDLAPLLAQAAVYLDPYPCSSLTSWLDAALAGLPVVTYRPPHMVGSTLCGDDPADGEVVLAPDPLAWAAAVRALLDDPAGAAERGARLRAQVVEVHTDGWASRARAVVEGVAVLAADQRRVQPVTSPPTAQEAAVAQLHHGAGQARAVRDVLASRGVLDVLPQVAPLEAPAAVSAVVAVSGGAQELGPALAGLRQACAAFGRLDVQVLDLGVDEAGARALEAMEDQVRTVCPGDVPQAAEQGWSLAMHGATAGVLVLLSSDVRPDRAALEACLRRLGSERPGVAVVPALVDSTGAPVGHGALGSGRRTCMLLRRDVAIAGTIEGSVLEASAVCRVVG